MLIPPPGVHVFATYFPRGFYVARYDREGFAFAGRWFATRAAADAYAQHLAQE